MSIISYLVLASRFCLAAFPRSRLDYLFYILFQSCVSFTFLFSLSSKVRESALNTGSTELQLSRQWSDWLV